MSVLTNMYLAGDLPRLHTGSRPSLVPVPPAVFCLVTTLPLPLFVFPSTCRAFATDFSNGACYKASKLKNKAMGTKIKKATPLARYKSIETNKNSNDKEWAKIRTHQRR